MATKDSPAANLRSRKGKSDQTATSEVIANGASNAILHISAIPTEHGQEMDKKLDEHQSCVSDWA